MGLGKFKLVTHCLLICPTVLIGCFMRSIEDPLLLFDGKYKKLAKAVSTEDTSTIKHLVLEKGLKVDYQEPMSGETLLMWAVQNGKYLSSKSLLEIGADPNLKSLHNETSAFMFSAQNYSTSDFVKLLLKYGGNANDSSDFKGVNYLRTPLIAASSTRLESVKLLVESGANIDYISHHSQSAIGAAINSERINIARYLIIEKGANFKLPICSTINGDTLYIVNGLRYCVFPLESEDYKVKMEIVNYMLERGVDYWKTPIPKHYFNNYDSVYLSKY